MTRETSDDLVVLGLRTPYVSGVTEAAHTTTESLAERDWKALVVGTGEEP